MTPVQWLHRSEAPVLRSACDHAKTPQTAWAQGQSFSAVPLCEWTVHRRVPLGFHAAWITEAQCRGRPADRPIRSGITGGAQWAIGGFVLGACCFRRFEERSRLKKDPGSTWRIWGVPPDTRTSSFFNQSVPWIGSRLTFQDSQETETGPQVVNLHGRTENQRVLVMIMSFWKKALPTPRGSSSSAFGRTWFRAGEWRRVELACSGVTPKKRSKP